MVLKQRLVGGDGDGCFTFECLRIDLLCTRLGYSLHRIRAV